MEKVNNAQGRLVLCLHRWQRGFYRNPCIADHSRMNVPFTLADAALDAVFLAESKAAGLVSLKGHKSVGGMRASIYNAMPTDGLRTLINFMDDFRRRNA